MPKSQKTALTIGQPDKSTDPFQRLEDFAKKIIAVPKSEIDKAEKNEKRRKKRNEKKSE